MKKVVIGLGNPGVKYKFSRHNLGFLVVDAVTKSLGIKKWKNSVRFAGKYCVYQDVAFLKPDTFMNNSGTSVAKFLKYHQISPSDVFVIHDDIDLPFLKIKTQIESGSAGHNGVEDIIDKIGTNKFWRVRVGIGRPSSKNMEVSDWVLANFSKAEIDSLLATTSEIKEILTL